MRRDPPKPGQTPLDDLSGLRLKHVRTQAQLDAAEAENIRKATVKYLAAAPSRRSAPFDYAWLLRLHAEMFGEVWSWAGQLRRSEKNIGTAPQRIEIAVHELLSDLHAWQEAKMAVDEQAVMLHHRAVLIHPFDNGNGRWARMLANIWLSRQGACPIEWPETTIGAASTIRDEYLAAVRSADLGDYSKLIALHARFSRSH